MKIIDMHSHVDYITHNVQADVVGTCCCAVKESQWQNLIDMANRDDKIFPCFGIHPWFVIDIEDGFDIRLKDLLKTNRAYMVGEIGLDKFKPSIEKQIDVFIKQLDIAIELKRNVVLHCVGAWDKIFHIFGQYKKSKLPLIIVHGFNDSEQIMQNLLDNYNVMFSVGKNSVYGKKCRIEQIPNDKILVETDGKPDVILVDIINKISEIKHEQNIADIIYDNSLKVLRK